MDRESLPCLSFKKQYRMCIGKIKGEEAGVWGGSGGRSEGLLTAYA